MIAVAQLYEDLSEPNRRLERWSVKPQRAVVDPELRATAYALMADFEQLISTPHVELEIKTSEPPPGEPEPTDFLDDYSAVNTLLSSVRHSVTLVTADQLRRALRVRMPELSREYEKTLTRFLEYLRELEKVLIMYGAGDDGDLDLVKDTVPAPTSGLRPGPSVSFEL